MAKADWTDNRGSMEGCCIGLGMIQEVWMGQKLGRGLKMKHEIKTQY